MFSFFPGIFFCVAIICSWKNFLFRGEGEGEREKNQFCDPIMSITFIVCEKCRFFSENSNAALEILIWHLQRGVSKEVSVELPVGLRGCVA
jgi:hypothetical protein